MHGGAGTPPSVCRAWETRQVAMVASVVAHAPVRRARARSFGLALEHHLGDSSRRGRRLIMRRARGLAPLPRFYDAARVCDVSGACCVQLRGAGGEEGGLIVASTQSLASRWSFRDPTSTRDLHVPALLPTRATASGRFQSRFCGDEMVMPAKIQSDKTADILALR